MSRSWAAVLGQWLVCGFGGALLCLLAAVVFVGTGVPSVLWGLPVYGFCWGLIGGALAGAGGWLYERARRGARPGELILTAFGLCVAALLGVVGGQVGWGRLPAVPGAPWPLVSMYVRPYTMAALAAVGGAIGGAVLWGWPRESRRAAARNAAVGVLLALATAYVVWPEWSPFAKGARDMARNASCQANLKSLGLSLRMYAEAWDGRLPPCKTANDLVGVDYDKLRAMLAQRPPVGPPWAALGGGPLHEVLRNAQMFGCPSDPANFDWRGRPVLDRYPEPGVSYAWNAKWAGKRITSVPDGEWLLRDREPWHHGGWNVVFRDARVKWQRPVEAPR